MVIMIIIITMCRNPVQVSEVEQHDVILVVDCVSQLFLVSVNLEDCSIATIPVFRCIKTIFIASNTRTGVLFTQGSPAAKPIPTFSLIIQTDQVTYSNITMAFCTEDLEYILAAASPLILTDVQTRTFTDVTISTGF